MIDIYFKPCCHSCNSLDPDYEQTSRLGELVTAISCSHACVCGKYQADPGEEEEAPLQDVIVKGFCHADG